MGVAEASARAAERLKRFGRRVKFGVAEQNFEVS